MGFGNRRRNLGNELLITDALMPELDQDEDQTVPSDSVAVEEDIGIPQEIVSTLKKSLSNLVLPLAAQAYQEPETRRFVRRRLAKGKRNENVVLRHRQRVLFFPIKLQKLIQRRLAPTLEGSTLRFITLSTPDDVLTHTSLVHQANFLVKKEFAKVGCNVGDAPVEDGIDDGFAWDMIVLSHDQEGKTEELVLAVLERTFMREYLWIHHLAVEGDYASLGLGTWLVDRAKHLVQLRSKEGILLFALQEVLDWYSKKGFVDWGKNDWNRVFKEWSGDRVMIWKPPIFS
jgi:hypothetical protein